MGPSIVLTQRSVVGSITVWALLCLASSAPAITYTYDELDRLNEIVYDDGSRVTYTYDAAGNRLTRVLSVDPDQDGVFFAGGANICTGGQTSGCEDNCPGLANADQVDPDSDSSGNVCDVDDDGDGLDDIHETDTRVYVSPTDTGADPLNPDTDADGHDDVQVTRPGRQWEREPSLRKTVEVSEEI
jgi:YD repeat-containing protein